MPWRALALIAVVGVGLTMCTGCATSPDSDWRPIDTRREIAFQLINVADAWQTNQIQYRADLVEVGPLARAVMGPEPRTADVVVYFTTLGVSHYLIARALPPKWRAWWQAGNIAHRGVTVYENCVNGRLC